ncbi:hypothetical protein BC830DRAFT_1232165, partial [Chytriomyces sp. MP71]
MPSTRLPPDDDNGHTAWAAAPAPSVSLGSQDASQSQSPEDHHVHAIEVETLSSTEIDESSSSSSVYSNLFYRSTVPSGFAPKRVNGNLPPRRDDTEATPLLVGEYPTIGECREGDSALSRVWGSVKGLFSGSQGTVAAAGDTRAVRNGVAEFGGRMAECVSTADAWVRDKWTVMHQQAVENWIAFGNYVNDNYTHEQKQYASLAIVIIVGLYLLSILFIYNPPPTGIPVEQPPLDPIPPPPPTIPDLPPPPPTDPPPPVLEPAPLCTSKECVMTSASILMAVDDGVDPCTDFFQYSCGNWLRNHPVPSTASKESTMTSIGKNNNKIIRDILQSELPQGSANDYLLNDTFVKLQTLYKSCTAFSTSLTSELTHILETHILSQTPLVERSFPIGTPHLRSENMAAILKASQDLGMGSLFTITTDADPIDPSVYIPVILPVETSLLGLKARELYNNPSVIKLYTIVMATALDVVFGNNVGISQHRNRFGAQPGRDWNKTATMIVAFERELVKILPSREDMALHPDAGITMADLQTASPFISWTYYLRLALQTMKPPGPDFRVLTPGATITYLTRLNDLLVNLDNTEGLDGYFMWSAVWRWGKFAGRDLKSMLAPLRGALEGVKGDENPEDACIDAAVQGMPDAVGRWFVEQAFGADSVKASNDMMITIKSSFQAALPSYKWLDKSTSLEAQRKVAAVLATSGYNPVILDSKYLAGLYKEFDPQPDSFMENIIKAEWVGVRNTLAKAGKPVDRRDSLLPITVVNAVYNPASNAIMMNAGIMQEPCFSASRPAYLNYGACGAVMGHELTHGFDNTGRKYDASGKSRDWWTPATATAFTTKAQCFIDQYNNYTVEGPGREILH